MKRIIDYREFLQHLEQKGEKDKETIEKIELCKELIHHAEEMEKKAKDESDKDGPGLSELESQCLESRKRKKVIELLKSMQEAENERLHNQEVQE